MGRGAGKGGREAAPWMTADNKKRLGFTGAELPVSFSLEVMMTSHLRNASQYDIPPNYVFHQENMRAHETYEENMRVRSEYALCVDVFPRFLLVTACNLTANAHTRPAIPACKKKREI